MYIPGYSGKGIRWEDVDRGFNPALKRALGDYAVPKYSMMDRYMHATAAKMRGRGTVDYKYSPPNVALPRARGTFDTDYAEYVQYQNPLSGLGGSYIASGATEERVEASRKGTAGSPPGIVELNISGLVFRAYKEIPGIGSKIRYHSKKLPKTIEDAVLTAFDKWSGTPGNFGMLLGFAAHKASKEKDPEKSKYIKIDAMMSGGKNHALFSFAYPGTIKGKSPWGKEISLEKYPLFVFGTKTATGYSFEIDKSRKKRGIVRRVINGLKTLTSTIVGLPVDIVEGIAKGIKGIIEKLKELACKAAQDPLAQIALEATSESEASRLGSELVSKICGGKPEDIQDAAMEPQTSYLPILLIGGGAAAAFFLL